jgi:tripartite-type tricarboxylate transporter receptor subunit TctC
MRFRLFALLLSACPLAAMAQAYPSKPVRFVSTFGAGSAADVSIRMVASKMGDAMGQPVVIDVRAGGGGVVGAEFVSRATPDGYTILHSQPTTVLVTPLLLRKPPYDPIKDFTPITRVIDGATCVVVNASVPVNSVKELIEYIKKNPGKLAYGHNGIGGTYHLQMELLKQQLGLDITPVPYKGGIAAILDAVAGNVPIAFGAAGSAQPHVRSGKLKMLAVMDTKRFPDLPDVPALSEDLPGIEKLPTGLDLYGPAGLPGAIVARLHAEALKAVRQPDVAQKLKDVQFSGVGTPPAEYAAQHRRDLDNFVKAVKAAGIKPE